MKGLIYVNEPALLCNRHIGESTMSKQFINEEKSERNELKSEPGSVSESETGTVPKSDLKSGDILKGVYQVMERIGKGGGGIVYKAYHLRLQKYVVVKKISDNIIVNMNSRVEVDILKRLHHTNLPQVYDFLQIGGQVFTVMDFISGKDMEYYLSHRYFFTEAQMVYWLRQLCQVLIYLHSQNPVIIHCDIKPANIMIDEKGDICLIDFNISLEGDDKKLIGLSQEYAAPEQIELAKAIPTSGYGKHIRVDERTDIYSLGAVYYRLLTGRIPQADLSRHVPLDACQSDYSEGLMAIINKAMQPHPGKRYQSAQDMLKAVDNIEKQERGYQRIIRMLSAGIVICSLACFLGVWCVITGFFRLQRERYQEDYAILKEYLEDSESTLLVRQGIRILNNKDYAHIIRSSPEEKSEIFHAISVGCQRENNSISGIYYLAEAISICENKEVLAQYYQEYVKMFLKDGDWESAAGAIQSAEVRNISNTALMLMKGEVYAAKGEYGNAIVCYEGVAEEADNKEHVGMAYLRLASVYGAEKDYITSIRMLGKAEGYISDRNVYRQMAETCMEYAMSCHNSGAALEYRRKAIQCYQTLCNMPNAAYLDKLNLTILYLMNQQNQDARMVLEELTEIRDYRIYMYLAYANYNIQAEKAPENRDYKGVLRYYQEAESVYQEAGSPMDDNMTQLRILAKEIE